jgi:hypothetical protein
MSAALREMGDGKVRKFSVVKEGGVFIQQDGIRQMKRVLLPSNLWRLSQARKSAQRDLSLSLVNINISNVILLLFIR